MPVAFKSATALNFGSSTSWTITKPSLANNDFVIIYVVTDTDHGITAAPTNFSNHGTGTDDVPDSSLSLFSHYITSVGAEGVWTVQFATTENGSAGVLVYTGVDSTTPLNPAPNVAGATFSTTSPATVSHTPGQDNSMIVVGYGSDPATTFDGVPNGSFVERLEHFNGTAAFLYAMDLLQTTAAAATGQPTGFASDRYNRFIMSLAPSTGGAAPASGEGLIMLGVG